MVVVAIVQVLVVWALFPGSRNLGLIGLMALSFPLIRWLRATLDAAWPR